MSAALLPPARPMLSRAVVERRIARYGITDAVYVYAVRGYYADTLGVPGKNDRGIYDDAAFIVSPTAYAAFNANTDPSVFRPGIASLCPGIHRYRPGRHGISRGAGYPAFRPATPGEQLPVERDGVVNPRPGVAINIHRGAERTTSSEGCQTIPPAQWDAFHALLSTELKRHGQATFPYILTLDPRLEGGAR